jgi:hypothetical protein
MPLGVGTGVRSTTADNGVELSGWRGIGARTGAACYFATPYHSYQVKVPVALGPSSMLPRGRPSAVSASSAIVRSVAMAGRTGVADTCRRSSMKDPGSVASQERLSVPARTRRDVQ